MLKLPNSKREIRSFFLVGWFPTSGICINRGFNKNINFILKQGNTQTRSSCYVENVLLLGMIWWVIAKYFQFVDSVDTQVQRSSNAHQVWDTNDSCPSGDTITELAKSSRESAMSLSEGITGLW